MNKSTLPVSKKFHAEICARVSASFSKCQPSLVRKAIAVIERYMLDGTDPSDSEETAIQLMFNLLRPEIDKAITRSRRARERSKNRNVKQQKTAPQLQKPKRPESSEADINDDNTDLLPEEEATPKLNRRMRRLIKQKCKRATRLRVKPLSERPQAPRG